MKKKIQYALMGGMLAAASPLATAADEGAKECTSVYQDASKTFAKSPEKVLELVNTLVAANESCASEVVKAAIITTKADADLVAQIVETAGTAAPKQITSIAKAAYVSAPDAKEQIVAAVKTVAEQSQTAQNQLRKDPLGDLSWPPGIKVINPGRTTASSSPAGRNGLSISPVGTTE